LAVVRCKRRLPATKPGLLSQLRCVQPVRPSLFEEWRVRVWPARKVEPERITNYWRRTPFKTLALGLERRECRSYLRLVMSQELVLTVINTTSEFNGVRSDSEGWLKDSGASDVTVRSYVAAIRKWLKIIDLNPGIRPVFVWQRSNLSASVKRVVGYACRRYTMFASEVLDLQIDLGVPSRLPSASRPNPKPISEKHLRELGIAAKQLFPLETSFSFRVWIQFLNETGCRRSESEIDWSCINWLRRSVVVRGKTGERELPLSPEMIRRL
jgi:hypothetical protein